VANKLIVIEDSIIYAIKTIRRKRMKRILTMAMAMVMITGLAQASSKVDIPLSVRLSDGTNWLFTEGNAGKVTVTNGTITAIETPVAVITTQADEMTVFPGAVFNGIIDSGVLTSITNDVGIKDNGNIISVDSAQLPSALDGSGNLKVGIQGTVPVNIVGSAVGTPVNGYYALSIGAGQTLEIGSYTVTAGKTLRLNAFGATFKGDGLVLLQVAGVNKKALGLEATNPQADVYMGDNYTIPAGVVLSATVTNNEAVAVTAYLSWAGLEVIN